MEIKGKYSLAYRLCSKLYGTTFCEEDSDQHKRVKHLIRTNIRPKIIVSMLQKSGDDNCRFVAAYALGEIKVHAAENILIQALHGAEGQNCLSEELCTALGKLKSKEAVPLLIEIINRAEKKYKDGDYSYRSVRAAIQALGDIGDKDAASFLLDKCLETRGHSYYSLFADALSKINMDLYFDELCQALKASDKDTRWAAAETFYHIKVNPNKINETTSVLMSALEHEFSINKDDRFALVQQPLCLALGKIKAKKAVPLLLKLLYEHGDNTLIWLGAVPALGKIRDKAATPYLMKVLSSYQQQPEQLVCLVIGAAGKIKNKELIPFLAKLLQDNNKDFISYACEALGQIGGQDSVNALTDFIKSTKDNYNFSVAIQALKKIQNLLENNLNKRL